MRSAKDKGRKGYHRVSFLPDLIASTYLAILHQMDMYFIDRLALSM